MVSAASLGNPALSRVPLVVLSSQANDFEEAGCENEVGSIVADKGYHSMHVVMQAVAFGTRLASESERV